VRPLALKLAIAFAIAAALATPLEAAAGEFQLTDVRVAGGEDSWHPEPSFRVDWAQVPPPPAQPGALVYRLFDPSGAPIGDPVRRTNGLGAIERLWVPDRPGAYRAEIWLEDTQGEAGPHAEVTLRYDGTVPSSPEPAAPPGWLAGGEAAELGIGHPPPPLPPSGISGYAISLDRGEPTHPCASPVVCDPAEIDLPGGIADDSISLGALPEGTTWARVVAVSGAGVPSAVASVALRVDASRPELALLGVPDGWARAPVRITAIAADRLSGMTAAGPLGPFTAIALDGGAPALDYGSSSSIWVSGDGVHTVAATARDAAGNVVGDDPGVASSSARIAIDATPPSVAFAASQDPREPERIEARVADPLSGPSPSRGEIALRPAGSHGPFLGLPTRRLGDALIAVWDSDAYRRGKYEFLATGYDRAGNAARGSRRVFGGPMVLVNPVKEPARLNAGFGRTGARRLQLRYGRSALFGGRLSRAGGRPLGAQRLTIVESFAPGARRSRRATRVITRANGTFAVHLSPGPSRTVSASFAGTSTLTAAASTGVPLGVRSAISLRTSAARAEIGGAAIAFSGRVASAGAAVAGEGLPVQLQFRCPGSTWSEFRSLRTDARGRFRYAYRFSDDDSRGVRFQFRAAIKAEDGWPYEPAVSRPVIVTGA
jgi:hypothetical protein